MRDEPNVLHILGVLLLVTFVWGSAFVMILPRFESWRTSAFVAVLFTVSVFCFAYVFREARRLL